MPKEQIEAAVERAARILQIEHLLARKPKALSGGQRQRVAIGRAIVRTPGVFLFDEPLSNLDAALRVQMRVELAQLHRELSTTMIYVTHDQVEAMTLASRIVVLNAGRIEQVGSPMQLYHHPDNLFVASFIGSPRMNLLDVSLVSAGSRETAVRLSDGTTLAVHVDTSSAVPGSSLTLGIRPEHLQATASSAAQASSLKGQIKVAEHLGDMTYLHVSFPGAAHDLVIRADADNPLQAGDTAYLTVPPQRGYLFDRSGRAFARCP
jgi:multiple sugar transport system ATP-binding protein